MTGNQPQSPYTTFMQSYFSESALANVPRRLHLQTLDSAYACIERALFEARRFRNKKTGPGSLPIEVLVEIFRIHQSLCLRKTRDTDLKPAFHPRWTTVTHVCSYWRDVALDAPVLWANSQINVLTYPRYIPAIVSRARQMPLYLDMPLIWPHIDLKRHAGVKALLLCSPPNEPPCGRAKWLSLTGGLDMFKYVARHLPRKMKHLCQLSLTIADEGDDNPTLPPNFGDFGTVTHLTLQYCRISWNSPIFSREITSLCLETRGNGLSVTYSKARALFTRLVSLESLTLENVVPTFTSKDALDPIITLPSSLRKLKITVSTAGITTDGLRFMSYMRTPPLCSRHFCVFQVDGLFGNDTSSDPNLKRILPQLAFHGLTQHPTRQLELGFNNLTVSSVELPQRFIGTEFERFPVPIAPQGAVVNIFEVAYDYDGEYPLCTYDFSATLNYVSLSDLRVISFTPEAIETITAKGQWAQLLHASNVRRIDLQTQDTDEVEVSTHFPKLLEALCYRQTSATNNGAQFLFPRLETLVLDFRDEVADDDDEFELFAGVVDLVRARRELGVPLKEIVIPEETSSWAKWDDLRSAVEVTLLG